MTFHKHRTRNFISKGRYVTQQLNEALWYFVEIDVMKKYPIYAGTCNFIFFHNRAYVIIWSISSNDNTSIYADDGWGAAEVSALPTEWKRKLAREWHVLAPHLFWELTIYTCRRNSNTVTMKIYMNSYLHIVDLLWSFRIDLLLTRTVWVLI